MTRADDDFGHQLDAGGAHMIIHFLAEISEPFVDNIDHLRLVLKLRLLQPHRITLDIAGQRFNGMKNDNRRPFFLGQIYRVVKSIGRVLTEVRCIEYLFDLWKHLSLLLCADILITLLIEKLYGKPDQISIKLRAPSGGNLSASGKEMAVCASARKDGSPVEVLGCGIELSICMFNPLLFLVPQCSPHCFG